MSAGSYIHKPLQWTGPIFAEHLAFLKSITTRTPKMTMSRLATLIRLLTSACAVAQEYPAKPIRMIVPFPPGGGNDVAGCVVAASLSERLGKLQYASTGMGSVTHLAAKLFKYTAKLDMLHVPFKGAACHAGCHQRPLACAGRGVVKTQ